MVVNGYGVGSGNRMHRIFYLFHLQLARNAIFGGTKPGLLN